MPLSFTSRPCPRACRTLPSGSLTCRPASAFLRAHRFTTDLSCSDSWPAAPVRQKPALAYSPAELRGAEPVPLSDGQGLALFLFRLKNGTREEQVRYAKAQEFFKELLGGSWTFEVGLGRGAAGAGDQRVELVLTVSNGAAEVPLEFAGAGIGEALWPAEPARWPSSTSRPSTGATFCASSGSSRPATSSSWSPIRPRWCAPSPSAPSPVLRSKPASRTGMRSPGKTSKSSTRSSGKNCRSADARAALFSSGLVVLEGQEELGALRCSGPPRAPQRSFSLR